MTEPHSPNTPGTSRLILGLWLLTAAVFLPAVRCGYVNWDDGKYVAQNPVVLGGLSWENCRHALTDVIFSNWALLLVDIWPLGRIGRVGPRPEASDPARAGRYPLVSWRAAIVEKLPLIGLAVVFSAVTIIAQGGAIQSAQSLPLVTSRLPNALHAFV